MQDSLEASIQLNQISRLTINIFELIKLGGMESLVNLLVKNSSVSELELNWICLCIGAEGANFIAQIIQHNSHIRKIYLERNFIGAQGFKCISKAIEKNSVLYRISIASNDIGAEGAKWFSGAIKRNSSLQVINLYGNSIRR
jgi:Ran GTPase-activating protein (RanGAP) involved in mRNA processing and transport